jgi:chemotaxis protein CheD
MPHPDGQLPEIMVQPGESRLVTKPAMLRTLLGSCVGVAFRAPKLGIAALCHPMMPRVPARLMASLVSSTGRRYVEYAIREMAERFDKMGVRRGDIEVKLFGGGDVLPVDPLNRRPSVGKMNGEAALRTAREEGLNVTASSLGGKRGVNIFFNTVTGEVLLQRHSHSFASPNLPARRVFPGEALLSLEEEYLQ